MTAARLTTDVLRQAAKKRVAEATLRDVADEIGMSFSGLKSFIGGGSPQKKTQLKLVTWFYQRTAQASGPSPEELEVALAQIKVYLQDKSKPRSVRERRREEIIERLKD